MDEVETMDMLKYIDYKYVEYQALENHLSKHLLCFDISLLSLIRPSKYEHGVLIDYLNISPEILDNKILGIIDEIVLTRATEISLSNTQYNKYMLYPLDLLEEVVTYLSTRYSISAYINQDDLIAINRCSQYLEKFSTFLNKLTCNYLDRMYNWDDFSNTDDISGKFLVRDIDIQITNNKIRGLLIIVTYYKAITYGK